MGSLSFDPIADQYDATRGGERRGHFVADVMRPWLPADGVLCEIGVGTALVATPVAARGATVVGVDISAGMLAVAARRHHGPLVRADATALPFAAGSLAAVYGVWVFHVVDDAGAVLTECQRVLRPGGRVLAVVTDETRRVGNPLLDQLEQRYRRRQDAIDHLDPLAAAVGLRRHHVEPLAPFRRPTAPAELADHLERRTWSWLWAVPPDVWAADVEPVIAALRAEPDPDVPRPHQNANLLAIWER
jgi:ubiquinone/menaquinone biosynthesis C-methylase UbiE